MNNREIIGARIKDLRAKNNMTQRDLAKAAEVSNSNIANIELGKYSVGLDVLSRILDVFGCTLAIIKKRGA